jgi:peptidyl-prolyl cis-trans isomerase C
LISIILTSGCLEGKKEAATEPIPTVEKETETVTEQKTTVEKEAVAAESKPAVTEEKIAEEKQLTAKVTPQAVQEANKPGVLVTVNGVDITEQQVNEIIQPVLAARADANQPMSESLVERYKSQILADMIKNILVEEQFKAHNVLVTEQDVNNVLDKLLTFSDPPMTYEKLKVNLEAQGMTLEQFKQKMGFKQKLEWEQLIKAIHPEMLQVTDEEAHKFYDENPNYFNFPEQVRASHILIRPEKTDPNHQGEAKERARAKAENILKQLREGANFEELAKQYSEDTISAKVGGDLNFFGKEKMIPAFSNAAFALKTGETSDVVETGSGFHIIKLTDRKDPYTVSFEKAKEKIVYSLKDQKLMDAVSEVVKELQDKATIIYPPGSTLRAFSPVSSTIRKPQENLLVPRNSQTKPTGN